MIAGLVLAGGGGSRFGGGKLLADLGGRPLVEYPILALAEAGVERIVVVAGADEARIRAEADTAPAQIVVAEGWESGQAESLKAGIHALVDAEAVVMMLGDQPLIAPEAINRVLEARSPGLDAVRASYDGVPSHPTVLERSLFPRLLELEGDIGARELLEDAETTTVPCDGLGSALDVDTAADLQEASRAVERQ